MEEASLSGTYWNIGCIPSMKLLPYANLFQKIQKAKNGGVIIENVVLDCSKVQKSRETF